MQRGADSGVVQCERIGVRISRRTDGKICDGHGVGEAGRSRGIQGDSYWGAKGRICNVAGIGGDWRTERPIG